MKSAKVLACSLHNTKVNFNMSGRGALSVSAEVAKKLFDKLEDESEIRPTLIADLEQNKTLNRWNNILPFDATRVKLKSSLPNNPVESGFKNPDFNDYINASRVDAPFLEDKAYILTQGPLPETIGHFWTMVYQQHVSAIVMLCRLTETNICKCAQYWPETSEEDDLIYVPKAGLEVRLRDYDTEADFLVRHLELRHCETDSIRVITQYHYLTWPDFGVPHSTSAFLKFLYTVTSKHPSSASAPNVVHCSAGVGRSGTFILADSCLTRMKETRKPMTPNQIIDSLLTMRSCRWGLIQTWEQLRFCLQAIGDGMNNIDFDPTDSNPTGQDCNGSRKRSTDSVNEEDSADENTEKRNNDSAPPKRPKC